MVFRFFVKKCRWHHVNFPTSLRLDIVCTGWTGKYVPPGSPQVAPMGATWGLPRTKVHHMFITNPESTNFRI